MKRSVLSSERSAWLAATIERNSRFAGMRMMADEPDPDDKPDPDKPDDKPDDKPSDDDKLGDAGKKAIQAERERAKAADDRAKKLEGEFGGFKDAMSEFLGIKPKEGDDAADQLVAIKDQLAAMQHESAVLKLANEHKITDSKDLDLLKSATGSEAMKALAERLAPAEEDPSTKRGSGRPRPDRTQGGGSGGDDKPRGGSVAQVMEERAAARAAKSKTTV